MTNKEAINIMSRMIKDEEGFLSDNTVEAHKMALKALEQEPCDNAVSRRDVLDLAKKGVLVSNGNYESVCKAINEIPPVNPQPCDDAISRAEAIKIASGYCHPANVANELAKLPPVNPQPCEDAISRQAVIDSLHSKFADGFDSDRWWNSMSVLYAINKVPPVNPSKTGHWKRVSMDRYTTHAQYWYKCDKCGELNLGNTDFCPNCGCRMVEPQERSDKG